jgi:hypothetical protein
MGGLRYHAGLCKEPSKDVYADSGMFIAIVMT